VTDLNLKNVRAIHLLSAKTGKGVAKFAEVKHCYLLYSFFLLNTSFTEIREAKEGQGCLCDGLHQRGKEYSYQSTPDANERTQA